MAIEEGCPYPLLAGTPFELSVPEGCPSLAMTWVGDDGGTARATPGLGGIADSDRTIDFLLDPMDLGLGAFF